MALPTALTAAHLVPGVLFAVFFLGTPLQAAQQLPEGFQKCPKDDATFGKCLEGAIRHALQALAPGIPSFSLPPLDPTHVPQIALTQTDSRSPVNLNITLTNIDIYGLKDGKATEVTSNLNNYQIAAKGHVDHIYVEADYVMNGRILVLPVTGSGRAHANITGLDGNIALAGERNEKNGREYMKVTNFLLDLYSVQHISIYFDNLFNGDKALGDSTNAAINDNWQEFWRELRPPFEETLRYTFLEYSKRIFNRVPYDDAFLP